MSEMEPEIWKAIKGIEHYEVSNCGRVRRAVSSGCSPAGKILTPQRCGKKRRYLKVSLRSRGRTLNCLVHRLVALAFLSDQPSPVHEIAHNDGQPTNNAVGNLRWVTNAENLEDKVKHGRLMQGERQYKAKLSDDAVLFIRSSVAGGTATQRALALRFGVHFGTINDVVKRRTWAHI